MIFLKKIKAECRWKMFIEKQYIIHIEFRKAKEMERNGKENFVHDVHVW